MAEIQRRRHSSFQLSAADSRRLSCGRVSKCTLRRPRQGAIVQLPSPKEELFSSANLFDEEFGAPSLFKQSFTCAALNLETRAFITPPPSPPYEPELDPKSPFDSSPAPPPTPTPKQAVQLLDLPDSALEQVFAHLPFAEQLANQRVCQRFAHIAQTSSMLFRHVNLAPYRNRVSDSTAVALARLVGNRPTHLDLSHCYHITDVGFLALVGQLDQLETFRMTNVWTVSAAAIATVRAARVDLSYTRNVTDSAIRAIAGPQTTHLKLRFCKEISDATLQYLVESSSMSLRELDLARCSAITDRGFLSWGPWQFPQLQSIGLAECVLLSDLTLMYICRAAPNLEIINAPFCTSLTEMALDVIAMSCPRLLAADFSYCPRAVSDRSLHNLAVHLVSLRQLAVRGCCITEYGMSVLNSMRLDVLLVPRGRNS